MIVLMNDRVLDKCTESKINIQSHVNNCAAYTTKMDRLLHETISHIDYTDAFVYNLAKACNINTDYFYGWTEDSQSPFIPIFGDLITAQDKCKEISRIIYREIAENPDQGYNNSNVLAGILNLERDLLDMLMRKPEDCVYYILPSFDFFAKLCNGFKLDFVTLMTFVYDGETNPDGKALVDKMNTRYTSQYVVKDTISKIETLDMLNHVVTRADHMYVSSNTVTSSVGVDSKVIVKMIPVNADQNIIVSSDNSVIADADYNPLTNALMVHAHSLGSTTINLTCAKDHSITQSISVVVK